MKGMSGNGKRLKDSILWWCQHGVLAGAHYFGHNFLLKYQNPKLFLSKFSPACALQISVSRFCWFGYLKAKIFKMLKGVILSLGNLGWTLWSWIVRMPPRPPMWRGTQGSQTTWYQHMNPRVRYSSALLKKCAKWCKMMIVEY